VEVQTVRTTTDDKIQEKLPDKVETLWQNSSEYLNQDERVQLRQLLHKYRDIFSKDEFDTSTSGCISVTVSAMAMIASLLIVNERSVVFARHNLG
jgi:hypothetical protein